MTTFLAMKAPFLTTPLGTNLNPALINFFSFHFLVFPSIWGETFGMVIIESFANGLPIIASNLGSMAEIIKNDFNGLHFNPTDSKDLISKIKILDSNKEKCNQMSLNAISEFQSYYTEEKNYELLI